MCVEMTESFTWNAAFQYVLQPPTRCCMLSRTICSAGRCYHRGLHALQVLLVVLGAVNFQLYGRVTLEVIDYLLQDPLDGGCLLISHLHDISCHVCAAPSLAASASRLLQFSSVPAGLWGKVPGSIVVNILAASRQLNCIWCVAAQT